MATTKWRGDFSPTRQIDKIEVTNVGIGDTFKITCNRKVVSFIATEATASSVYDGLTALLGDNATIPEFTEITPLDTYNSQTGYLWLQGPEDGTPFTATVSKVNGSATGVSVETLVQGVAGQNCKQTVTVTATGGTFTLSFLGVTTGNIAYNASAGTVDTALEALSSIGTGNVTVTDGGTSGNTRRWVVEFTGTVLGYATQPLLVANGASLTGVINGVVTEQQKGAPATNHKFSLSLSAGSGTNGIGTVQFTFTNPYTLATAYGSQSLDASGASGNQASLIQSKLQSLLTIGSGNVTVTRTSQSSVLGVYSIEFTSALGGVDLTSNLLSEDLTANIASDVTTTQTGSATSVNEKQVLSFDAVPGGGTFTVTYAGQTTAAIAYNASAATVQTELIALSNIGASEVSVSKATANGMPFWTVEFLLTLSAIDQPMMTMTTTSITGGPAVVVLTQEGATGTSEVQEITLTGTPTGGTFTLTYSGQTTSTIAYNAAPSVVQAALEALSNIADGDVAVTGPPGGPYVVTYQGNLIYLDVVQLTGDGSSLTAGAGDETIALTSIVTPTGPNWYSEANNWTGGAVPSSGDTILFESNDVDCLYGINASVPQNMTIRVLGSYTGKIGLPVWNSLGYYEYRDARLCIGSGSGTVTLAVGQGDGDGSTRLRFNTGAATTTIDVFKTDQADDDTTRAFDWIGTGTNTVRVHDGQCAIAPYDAEAATVATLTVSENGDTLVGPGGICTAVTSQGDLLIRSALQTSLTINDGTTASYGSLNSATVTVTGGTWESHNSGTATAVTVGPGDIDCTDDYTAKTFTTLTLKQGATVSDPNHIITATTLSRGSDVDEFVIR